MSKQQLVKLPEITNSAIANINALLPTLGIPRTVLASDDDIEHAWSSLPRQLQNIPIENRDELIARMCVATSVGLFDSAINYVWNSAILNLRDKVRDFGLHVIAQILQKDFEEKQLLEMQDSELLRICLQINIIDEQGYFFLSQSREIRNNYSAAHPSLGMIDVEELLVFSKRCITHSLANTTQYTGIAIKDFISSLKAGIYDDIQREHWKVALHNTYNAQRALIVKMMHGMYCDENSAETTRQNIVDLCLLIKEQLTSQVTAEIITNHNEYKVLGRNSSYTASLKFFELLGLLDLLTSEEIHSLFHRAVERLWNVHQEYNNFYNEPPFAERLHEISKQNKVPSTIQTLYVETVTCCFIGNGYGVCTKAEPYYQGMIENFSPQEIGCLLKLSLDNSAMLNNRINSNSFCKARFKQTLKLINEDSIPDRYKAIYQRYF